MKISNRKFKKLARAVFFSLSLLILINLLFMFVSYVETQNLQGGIVRPNLNEMTNAYKNIQFNYADVQNHILLMKNGYEKINTQVHQFNFTKRHINWAYFPLYPVFGNLVNLIIESPFWSLWIINQLVLLSAFVGFYYWNKAYISGSGGIFSAWLILLFFTLPPLGYFVNFLVLPGFLLAVVFFTLRNWLQSPQKNLTSFWICATACFLIGLSRFQGLLLNASLLLILLIITCWYKKPLGKAKVFLLFLANIFPSIIIMIIFKYYANDPFAWAKTQISWGRSFTWPWNPIIKYWKSGLVFNLFNDELIFTCFRLSVFFIFAVLAARTLIFKKKVLKTFIWRRFDLAFINLGFIVISLGLLILPLTQGVLLSAHRYMTLAFLLIIIFLEQRKRIPLLAVLFLLFVRAAEFTLFFQGSRAFVW